MRLRIAELHIDITCNDSIVEYLPNMRSFVADGNSQGDEAICHIATGQTIAPEATEPTLTSISDDKSIRLWLKPDECKLSLLIRPIGKTYWLQADRRWQRVAIDCPADDESAAYMNDFIMIAFVYSSAFHGAATIHASSVAIAGEGCAFIGHSGIGKSTHSGLWLRHIAGTRLLNDDQPVVRIHADGTTRIYGSPWSGKTDCYRNEGANLRALFFMQQSPENSATSLTALEIYQRLLKATSLVGRDTVTFKAISHTLATISSSVPGHLLKNSPTEEAARLSHKTFTDNP